MKSNDYAPRFSIRWYLERSVFDSLFVLIATGCSISLLFPQNCLGNHLYIKELCVTTLKCLGQLNWKRFIEFPLRDVQRLGTFICLFLGRAVGGGSPWQEHSQEQKHHITSGAEGNKKARYSILWGNPSLLPRTSYKAHLLTVLTPQEQVLT